MGDEDGAAERKGNFEDCGSDEGTFEGSEGDVDEGGASITWGFDGECVEEDKNGASRDRLESPELGFFCFHFASF